MYQSALLAASLLSTLALTAPTTPASYSPSNNNTVPSDGLTLIDRLQLAPTAVDRIALLSAADFIYDFNNPPPDATTTGKGGHTVKADRKVFPALIGTGVGMTVGFIGPCGFNTLHTHPRSSEINIIVEGRLVTESIAENGAAPIQNTLEKYQMTVFPQGAAHTEFNPDYEPAVFVAGFASEDPGIEQAAQTLFEFDAEVVKADLGLQSLNGASIEEYRKVILANVALGVEQCLRKCEIGKK